MKPYVMPAIVVLVLFITGCRKQMETDSQRLWNQLEHVIQSEQVQRVVPTRADYIDPDLTYLIGNYGMVYQFHAPILWVAGEGYNLNSLVTYKVMTISNSKCLVLYFK